MAISAVRVTVTNTPVALNAVETDTVSGSKMWIKNTSANACDLGPSGITALGGFDLAAGATIGPIVLSAGELLYAIRSGASDATVSIFRTGV